MADDKAVAMIEPLGVFRMQTSPVWERTIDDEGYCPGQTLAFLQGFGNVLGLLLRGNVSSSRPSKRGGNSCRRSQDGDGPRYDGRPTSARCELAWCFPCVAMAMWIEAGTLPLSRSGVEPSLQKLGGRGIWESASL